MARHCLFHTDVRFFDTMDDLTRKDFINQCLFQALNANNINFSQITKLKGSYTKMEVKKNEMEDALKSVEAAMREQKAQHKLEIATCYAKLERLKEENWDFLGWVNEIYPDGDDEDDEGGDAEETGGDTLPQDPNVDGSPSQQADTEVLADIHFISSKERSTTRDLPSGQYVN
ncbi:hypothetical protein JCGZ_17092 [Jatropha curcas]|uniref:Uncharacterized protein n=1 Tax=Jatropha curcas TaxID=180498 RepID=A0A067K5R5_JATCU|nr:hypothetical protein JCGZ_17092 [Jatropha curcas]